MELCLVHYKFEKKKKKSQEEMIIKMHLKFCLMLLVLLVVVKNLLLVKQKINQHEILTRNATQKQTSDHTAQCSAFTGNMGPDTVPMVSVSVAA